MLSETWNKWYAANQVRIAQVVGTIHQPHPALFVDEVVTGICDSIRRGDRQAAELAISLLNEDPRMPFGRILKSRIARAFKAVAASLDGYQRHILTQYRDKLLLLDHPPRETREFSRLVRRFART